MNRRPTFLITMLCFGFAFFYIPILSMMVYSCLLYTSRCV